MASEMDKNQVAVSLFDKLAVGYRDKYMDQTLYDHSFDLFCEQVEQEGAKILEIGCGPGNITRYLLKKRPDFQILGTDLAPRMLELAREHNPKADFQLLDGREIGKVKQTFDGIVSGFFFPYLSKEEVIIFIKEASQRLNENGILYISTMEDDYSRSGPVSPSSGGPETIFMHYHQEDYITEALQNNGFHLVNSMIQDYPVETDPPTKDLLIIAKK